MTHKTPSIKLIKLPRLMKVYTYKSDSGSVIVHPERGKRLTYERINWLLDQAKRMNLDGK